MLAATIVLAAPLGAFYPAAGLDPSWSTGLNIAREHRLRFGPGLVFTYGPWGFLDHPTEVSRLSLLTGELFAIFAVGCAWTAFAAALRSRLGENLAALGAALLVGLCALPMLPSGLLMAATVLALLHYVGQQHEAGCSVHGRWIPAAAGGCAAFLLQVEFSEGALVAASAGCGALFGPERRCRRLVDTLLVFGATTVLAWTAIGQSPTDFPAWLRESLQVVRGYTDAMSLEGKPNIVSYLLIAAVAAVVIGYLIQLGRARRARVTVGIAVLTALSLYLGFREATGRHGPGHQKFYYLCALPILAWFVPAGHRTAFRLGALSVVVLLIAGSWQPISPATAANQWSDQLQALLDTQYRTHHLQLGKMNAQKRYALSPSMRAAVADRPVAVEPWETSLAWAYDLNWHPAPVFQSYVAYTHALDSLNATAPADAPADQRILQAAITRSVDGRNLLWDPPRSFLTEICDYRVQLSDSRWMLLAKTTNRCGPARPGPAQRVRAGQRVPVPTVAGDALITVSFEPDSPNHAVRLGRLLDKSFHPLSVTADTTTFRLPRALAGGPLLLNLPAVTGWPAPYGGGIAYHTVKFSEAGQVRFSVVELNPGS